MPGQPALGSYADPATSSDKMHLYRHTHWIRSYCTSRRRRQCSASTQSTVRRAIHNGELEALTLGERGRYRISRDALERFLRPANPTEEEL